MSTVKNKISELPASFSNDIKAFGITEVFVVNEELHTTSNYDLPQDLVERLEFELLEIKIPGKCA